MGALFGCFHSAPPRRGICPAASWLASIPIWLAAIVRIYLSAPSRVGHVGPLVLVEAWSVLQRLFAHVKDQALAIFVYREHLPGNGEQLVTDAEEAAKRKYRVCHAAVR